ncbi:MAG: L-aspartate oxidase [Campylobacterota bacterium]
MLQNYDVIIIGNGIAGLYASMNLPPQMKVLNICKDFAWECNTFYAQGGITTARDEKDIGLHSRDTLEAGSFANDKAAVEMMSKESLGVINDLIERGFHFDEKEGKLQYTKEAAHSIARILHVGDATGRYMHDFMMGQNNHFLLKNSLVYDLLIEEGKCFGVKVMIEYQPYILKAKKVIIASGGVGSLYEYHTNAKSISGDIQGICYEKGIELENMHYLQFHPTVFTKIPWARKMLLTEALRGEGATIVDEDGKRFVSDYDKRGELASRDVVSHAIFDYKKRTSKEVYLDLSNFSEGYFKKRFPNIYKSFRDVGLKPPRDRIPISPAFHYAIGGIKTDTRGRVLDIKNLYAIGECASSGVHGANRLASNSLLEGLVFGKKAAEDIMGSSFDLQFYTFDEDDKTILHQKDDKMIKRKLRRVMWEHVGIVRSREGLMKAKRFVYEQPNVGRLLQLRLNTAKAIIENGLHAPKSIGSHRLSDK